MSGVKGGGGVKVGGQDRGIKVVVKVGSRTWVKSGEGSWFGVKVGSQGLGRGQCWGQGCGQD